MNCIKCGAEIEEGSRFCEVCGVPVGDGAGAAGQGAGAFGGGNNQPQEPGGEKRESFINGGFDTKKIRKWFEGRRPWWPILLVVIGLLFLKFGDGVGMILFSILVTALGGACWYFTWMAVSEDNVALVDQAWNYYANVLAQRGMEKLNLIEEQVGMIDPVVVTGYGERPDQSFAEAKAFKRMQKLLFNNWIIGLIRKLISRLRKDETELDPYVKFRIASDERFRSMLQQMSVYMFTDTQVLVYSANIDISTGFVYKESTDEIFYRDIEGINFEKNAQTAYNPRKKAFVHIMLERVVLYLGGTTLTSNIIRAIGGQSVIDQQFGAMRELIRDKKNS